MQKLQIVSKVAVGLSSALLAIVGIVRLFSKGENIGYYILSIYLIVFAAMAVASIIPFKILVKYFSFLSGMVGIGIFLIFSGLIILNWEKKLELISSLCLLAAGGCNIGIGFYSGNTADK